MNIFYLLPFAIKKSLKLSKWVNKVKIPSYERKYCTALDPYPRTRCNNSKETECSLRNY